MPYGFLQRYSSVVIALEYFVIMTIHRNAHHLRGGRQIDHLTAKAAGLFTDFSGKHHQMTTSLVGQPFPNDMMPILPTPFTYLGWLRCDIVFCFVFAGSPRVGLCLHCCFLVDGEDFGEGTSGRAALCIAMDRHI